MSFIPIDKMKKLREAAAQGDERAKKILRAHLNGVDFAADLDSFFAPAPEPEPEQGTHTMPAVEPGEMPANVSTGNKQLDEWLSSNGIKASDEDFEEALEEYFNEYPDQRPEEPITAPKTAEVSEEIDLTKDIAHSIIETISKCDQVSLAILQNDSLDATVKKGAMSTIQEIKQTLLDGAEKLTKIKQTLAKKSEEEEAIM